MGVSTAWIVQTIIMVVIGIIGFFIKQSLDDMKKNNTKTNERLDKTNDKLDEVSKQFAQTIEEKMKCVDGLSKDLQDFKGKVADEYVKKTDYLHTNGEIMKKLDRIWDLLYAMKGGKSQ